MELNHFWGIAFGPVDTIFTGAGILAIFAGFYAVVNLHSIRLEDENEKRVQASSTDPLATVVAEDET